MDFYVVLGLDRGATLGDVKRAYRRLARKYHPDINPGDRTSVAVFRRVNEAYEILSDPGSTPAVRRQGRDANRVAGILVRIRRVRFFHAGRRAGRIDLWRSLR